MSFIDRPICYNNEMTISFLTLFPEYFAGVLTSSMLKKASDKQLVEFEVIKIREFASDKHKVTDDRPFGGGAGMVMKVEPIFAAIENWRKEHTGGKKLVIATSASGARFTQNMANNFSGYDHIAVLCGHYEGIDQRVLDNLIDVEVRIGDYVLTGGEPAAIVMADAIVRLIPDVLGNEVSLEKESHHVVGAGNYPQYTRPASFNGWDVPEVLQGGNHAEIEEWREKHRKSLTD